MAQVSEAATILVQSFGGLFDQAELDVQRGEEYPVPLHHRVVYDAPWSACKAPIPLVKANLSSCDAELGPY